MAIRKSITHALRSSRRSLLLALTFLLMITLLSLTSIKGRFDQPSSEHASKSTLSALLEGAVPTGLCFTSYDCDTARSVCYDMWNGMRMLCKNNCVGTGDYYTWCITDCDSTFVQRYSDCVNSSTNGQCFPYKSTTSKPGDN
jgi:hypothetical protein